VKRIIALFAVLALSACATTEPTQPSGQSAPGTPSASPQSAVVASLKGPTTMGLVELMADKPEGYDFRLYGTADEIVANLDSIQLALMPANLASVLYNKTGGAIQLAAVNTLGVLHVVAKGVDVATLADLAGKTVYSTGKGTTPQYVLEYLLAKNGLSGVKVEYLSEATEVAAKLAAAKTGVAVLPEPYVTVLTAKDPAVKSVIDLNDEWDKASPDSKQVTGVLVVKTAWAQANPERLASFLDAYKASIDAANADPAAVAPLIAEQGLAPSAAVAEKAIPGAHLAYLDGAQAKAAVAGYLKVLFDADPAAVGGALPDDGFYYSR
jgi:NitT/TauT family transport system substrate-binding protein